MAVDITVSCFGSAGFYVLVGWVSSVFYLILFGGGGRGEFARALVVLNIVERSSIITARSRGLTL